MPLPADSPLPSAAMAGVGSPARSPDSEMALKMGEYEQEKAKAQMDVDWCGGRFYPCIVLGFHHEQVELGFTRPNDKLGAALHTATSRRGKHTGQNYKLFFA